MHLGNLHIFLACQLAPKSVVEGWHLNSDGKRKINPIAQSIGVLKLIEPPHIVAIQEKILIPVGTAIIIVAAKKYAFVSVSNPTVYIW